MRRRVLLTGDAVLNETVQLGGPAQIEEIRLHLNAASATAENLTVTLDSASGAVYDILLHTQAMDTVQNHHWQPTRPINTSRGDALVIAWANTNSRTYGIEVIWSSQGV